MAREKLDLLSEMELGLRIDPDALDEGLIQQPELFYRISRELALTKSRRDQAKNELAETEARLDPLIRHDIEVSGEKVTEKQVEVYKRTNKDVLRAQENVVSLNEQVGLLEAMKEAFTQRSYALKDLVSLHIANYFGQDSHSKDSTARRSREGMDRMRRGG